MAKKKAREGYKHRKHGRNKAFCVRYRAEDREAKNKARNTAREKRRQKG
jgi:hypothetical protein